MSGDTYQETRQYWLDTVLLWAKIRLSPEQLAECERALVQRDDRGIPVSDIWDSLDHCAQDRDQAMAERDQLRVQVDKLVGLLGDFVDTSPWYNDTVVEDCLYCGAVHGEDDEGHNENCLYKRAVDALAALTPMRAGAER